MSPLQLEEILQLSVEERIQLVEAIWDSVTPESLPLTDAQRQELDRRLAEFRKDPKVGRSWPEVRDSLSSKK
ncbi:MAG: addiction module protein [Candidatus Polarisedimenticolia bacterium]